uniref:KIAA0040 n=1 Tax=Leptobrachium leishanense TaxID=445787 RepID=A0A8C5PT96_9ANUR
MEKITTFFNNVYEMVKAKHEEGLYNTICLAVLLILPLLLLFLISVISCHYCCCRTRKTKMIQHNGGKKKKRKNEEEDLWISKPQGKSIMLEKVPSFSV